MSFIICDKHKKIEKVGSKVLINGYVCMNRYCPDSFKVVCSTCKNDHKDHSNKLLSLEDTTFLLQRLQKLPFLQPSRCIGETLNVMKKLKLIKEFRTKIDILEKQIQKQALKLIDSTDSLILQYNICREGGGNLSSVLANIQQSENYNYFFQNSQKLLSNLDYNFKKDKLEYGSLLTKQIEDRRRKTLDSAQRKIQQVRDYSMKIIEVILHNEESDEQQEEINYRRKHYQVLKTELCLEKDQHQLEEEISELRNSKSTSNRSRSRKTGFDEESGSFKDPELVKKLQNKLQQLQKQHSATENELKKQLNSVILQKESLNQQLNSWKAKFEQKRKAFKELQVSLRQNKLQRSEKQLSKDDTVKKIIDLWQNKGSNLDDRHT